MVFDQRGYDIRCEWGGRGVTALAPISDVVVVVDVLSFSTSVDIAVNRGAIVYPYRGKLDEADEYAASLGAKLADPRRSDTAYSLSPESLMGVPEGTRIVLPSPNGSTLSLAAQPGPVLAGCLRNARATAEAASRCGPRIAVIPAGERWKDDGSLRPSIEDWIGAGAIIESLSGSASPEAEIAVAAFRAVRPRLAEVVRQCISGQELVERGFERDVYLASQWNVSDRAAALVDGAYVRAEA